MRKTVSKTWFQRVEETGPRLYYEVGEAGLWLSDRDPDQGPTALPASFPAC
jgi:hypothetical protein